MTPLETHLGLKVEAVNRELATLLPGGNGPERKLYEAMRYATLNGGKRLRPFLVISSAQLFDVAERHALRVAAAVELVHCYSLVHDDLPAMDDDDLRRGLPTCHVKFDEATAILAGDGLLTLAFAVLSAPETHPDAEVRCALVRGLSEASGALGMVGGQMFDLEAERVRLDLDAVTRLQQLKTGALFTFCCEAGAVLGRAPEAAHRALRAYAKDLGLAFQIADDLLDEEGTEREVGKKVGKDAAQGKATFVSLLGAGGARARARELAGRAAKQLDLFGAKAELLAELARFVVERRT
ncbi:MAG: polyprenyl synthetase family protein [Alphaproteobacteria bacterium]